MSAQQRKAADQLRNVADDLQEMAATGGAPGQAADLAGQAAGRSPRRRRGSTSATPVT